MKQTNQGQRFGNCSLLHYYCSLGLLIAAGNQQVQQPDWTVGGEGRGLCQSRSQRKNKLQNKSRWERSTEVRNCTNAVFRKKNPHTFNSIGGLALRERKALDLFFMQVISGF